jgi:hypothetical protein
MTVTLSKTEKSFLKQHKIPESMVFNALGLRKKEYAELMRGGTFLVAITDTPCKSAGHRLRVRSGHCVICNPAYLAYAGRFRKSAYIYVAKSALFGVCKVGVTESISGRTESLRKQEYGGYRDWEILFHQSVPNAASVEHLAKKELDQYRSKGTTWKDRHNQQSIELFKCDCSVAVSVIRRLLA